MKAMFVVAAMLLFVAMDSAHAGEAYQFDAMECSKLGGKMKDNPFALSIGELDTLSICAKTIASLKVNEQQSDKEIKAYERMNPRAKE